MIFPALLILLVSFCQVVMGLFCSRSGSISPGEFGAPFFMCLDSTVPFTTDPRKVPPLLLSGLCNAARTAVEKLTSACLSIRESINKRKRHVKQLVPISYISKDGDIDAYHDHNGSNEDNFDEKLMYTQLCYSNFRMLPSW
ncbi:hypothetical protein BASA61_008678 [Batrachochytrium salamandrivorans]|nr:hypothetical protein BASA61_008678 [Batrachochytrium salamandrivorans]